MGHWCALTLWVEAYFSAFVRFCKKKLKKSTFVYRPYDADILGPLPLPPCLEGDGIITLACRL